MRSVGLGPKVVPVTIARIVPVTSRVMELLVLLICSM